MPEVYAFTGKRGSGKSTATQVLLDAGFVEVKFADPLKNMLRAMYRTCGVDDATIERKIEGDLKEEPCEWLCGSTPRWAMVTLGTEWREMIHVEMWSRMFEKRVNSGDFGNKIVCSDYRFPGHEEEALKRLGARTYRIERPSLVDDALSDHTSESGVDSLPVDDVITNDTTIDNLQQEVGHIMEGHRIDAGRLEDWEIDALNRNG